MWRWPPIAARFAPSAWLDKPQVMLSLTVVAADTR